MPTLTQAPPVVPLLTAKQAAAWLNVSEEWLRSRARAGTIPSVRLGDAGDRSPQRFRRADLERFIHGAGKGGTAA
jgi:excisionase family DNA binding protein